MMEHDMREKARNAMRLILEAARFEVEEVDEPLDLSAVRDETCLLVLCSNDSDLIGQFDKTNYSLMIDDHEMSCKKLLFSVDKEIVTENCIQWGIDEFVRYTGEAVLADILDRELALDLTPSKGKKITPASPTKPAETREEEHSGIIIPHYPVKITEQAAMRIGGVQGAAKLRFIPYYLFPQATYCVGVSLSSFRAKISVGSNPWSPPVGARAHWRTPSSGLGLSHCIGQPVVRA